ncbi:MAG: tetratricopeptide repeat protein [Acidobacteriota bacterium]
MMTKKLCGCRAWNFTRRKAFPMCWAIALAFGMAGCSKLIAKDLLNQGAREYNKGRYEKAEKLFKEAMERDPDFLQAKLFYATAIRSRVNNEDGEEQVKAAKQAIEAYQELLKPENESRLKERDRDQTYAFIADLYKTLDDQKSYQEWLKKRAELPNQKPTTKAECLYSIGVIYWNEAIKISRNYETQVPGKLPEIAKPDKWKKEDVEALLQAVQTGLKYIEEAIAADPRYANAYSYKSLLLKEQAKATSDPQMVNQLERAAQEAIEKFQELNRQAAAELSGSS